MKRYIETTTADAQKLCDDAWDTYLEREIAARGLQPGDGLDVRPDGTRVHITTRYTEPIAVDGTTALVAVDSTVELVTAAPTKLESELSAKSKAYLTMQREAATLDAEVIEAEGVK